MWERYRVLGNKTKRLRRNACNRYVGNLFQLEKFSDVLLECSKELGYKKNLNL